jgi:hypothetical protein
MIQIVTFHHAMHRIPLDVFGLKIKNHKHEVLEVPGSWPIRSLLSFEMDGIANPHTYPTLAECFIK